MMKKSAIIGALFFMLMVSTAFAQHFSIGVGPSVNIPSGISANLSAIGFGGGVKAEYGFSDKYALTLNGEFVSFLSRRYLQTSMPVIEYIPVKAGFKYYPSHQFYLEAQGGVALPLDNQLQKAPMVSSGIGSFIPLGKSKNTIDVGIRYEAAFNLKRKDFVNTSFSKLGYIGIRLAYVFNINSK